MRAAGLLLLPVLLALAGCAEPPADAGPLAGHAWTEVDAEAWFTYTSGCGFCDGSGNHPEVETVVVYRDGSLLRYTFGIRHDAEDPVFEPGLEPWHDEVRTAHAAQHDGYSKDMARVFEVQTDRVADWEPLAQRLASLHGRLEDPGEPRFECDDCSAPWVEAFDPHVHAALHGNYEAGDDWYQVLHILWGLRYDMGADPLRT